MTAADRLAIRPLARTEMDLALDWAGAEGWNPGLTDAAPFHAADPEGFLLGEWRGEPVALVSAVRYGAEVGFVGFYIVKPGWRGQGHGWAVWQAAMARLAGRNVALDGVPAQQDNYRRSGFNLAWRNIRYQGAARPGSTDPAPLVNLADGPFARVAAYDRAFYPAERTAFLHAWITQPGSTALGWIDGDRLAGYGVIRPCRVGYKVGPLFADRPAVAAALFEALQARVPEAVPVFLDVPEPQAEAIALAERQAMTPMFETARMYTGPVPEIALARTYGITSFELG